MYKKIRLDTVPFGLFVRQSTPPNSVACVVCLEKAILREDLSVHSGCNISWQLDCNINRNEMIQENLNKRSWGKVAAPTPLK